MDDVRQRIQNALAILESPKSREPHQVPRTVGAAIDALRAAELALDARDAELDLVSSPDLQAAREIVRLRQELEAARERVARLERELATAREELSIEKRVHVGEREKLADLEARAQRFDEVLLTDDRAFERYMDRELDAREKKSPKRRE